MTNEEILALPMEENDSGAVTIREYLKKLLHKLWENGECFSGKRPFGNSGWEYDVYTALGKGSAIECEFDSDGYIVVCDDNAAKELITDAIASL